MKHFYILLLLIPVFIFSQTLVDESFSYPDGTVLNSMANWAYFSGNANEITVNSGKIVISDSQSEDIEVAFSTPNITEDIYASFDFSVADPSSYTGTDFEYFFMFKPIPSTSIFKARVDIAAFSASGYKPGISSGSSTAEILWAQDLSYATTYRMTVKYNTTTGLSQMWIDAVLENDTSISTTTPSTVTDIDAVAFRQSSASPDQSITIDNLKVATSFANTLSTDVSVEATFSIYPNPTSTDIVIITGMEGSKKAVLHDLMGRVVLKTTVNNRLNIAGIKTGVYLLEVTSGDKKATKKLIVK